MGQNLDVVNEGMYVVGAGEDEVFDISLLRIRCSDPYWETPR